MENQRNLVLAIAISILIMVGFQFLFPKPQTNHPQPVQQTEQQSEQRQATAPANAPPANAPSPSKAETAQPTPQGPAASTPVPAATAAAKAAEESPRIRIESPRLEGSIALRGARIDQLTLSDYHETIDPNSPPITLFTPSFKKDPYFAEYGWLAKDKSVPVPTADTVWKADSDTLSPGKPVTLTWDNGHGLVFTRTIAVDDNYLFTVTNSVANNSGQPVTLYSYGLISRTGTPETQARYILHEGVVGVLDGSLKEITYKSAREQKEPVSYISQGGWLGITDKYWLAAMLWDQDATVKATASHHKVNDQDKYQTDYLGPAKTIAPGATGKSTTHLFAGAKEVRLIDAYAEQLGVKHFDLAIDFGWFYFITKPFFYAIDWLNHLLGNFGLAILAFTLCVKAVFFPLANKSYRSMSAMRKLQPQMQALRERYKDDKAKLNQAVMELYRKEKVNPASGCLPIVIQIPVFFSLYKVLYVTIEMRHAPFFGWIHDLSAPDPTSVFNLFGLLPFAPPAFLPPIGAWAIIMGCTMFLQMRLNPQPADPIQAKIFMFMPLIFTVILAPFPAGLVIYWAWNNTLSMAQQWIIMRRMEKKTGARR